MTSAELVRAAVATARAHHTLLGDALAALEARLADAAALEPPPPVACPHLEEWRIDLATLGHPRRFRCRACGVTVDDPFGPTEPVEVSHGSADG